MNKNTGIVISVNESKIRIIKINNEDYISLTDLARHKNKNNPSDVIKKWLSNYDTIEFLGLWEELSNNNFNLAEFRQIKIESPKKSFTMSPSQWCKRVKAIGITCSKGKYSIGTFAHSDIAFEFASWIDNLFKLYLIKEFQRLKKREINQNKNEWHVNRLLSKVNYLVHTNAIKNCIVPILTDKQKRFIYQEEADILNVALFGMTAREWKEKNPDKEGNIRDNTDLLHLIILNNLESINSELIEMKLPQKERLIRLNSIAKTQIELIKNNVSFEKLKQIEKYNKYNLIEKM